MGGGRHGSGSAEEKLTFKFGGNYWSACHRLEFPGFSTSTPALQEPTPGQRNRGEDRAGQRPSETRAGRT